MASHGLCITCWSLQTPLEVNRLPFLDPDGRFQILLSGNDVRFQTPFHLVVEYDGSYVQSIVLPDVLSSSNLTGLCGNFNKEDDEKTLPDGTDYSLDPQSDSLISQYYEINDPTIDA